LNPFHHLHSDRRCACFPLRAPALSLAFKGCAGGNMLASGSGGAFSSGFAPLFRRSGVRTNRQERGFLCEFLCGLSLHDEKRNPFFSTLLNHAKRFLDGIDDESVFVHPHAASDFGYFIMCVFIKFDGNLYVVHMHLLDHLFRSSR